MSDREADALIKKYQHRVHNSKHEICTKSDVFVLRTQRKAQGHQSLNANLMNQSVTPYKDIQPSDRTSHYLKKLDQTQEKLAISDKTYVQLRRKYQRAKDKIVQLEKALQSYQMQKSDDYMDLRKQLIKLQQNCRTLQQTCIAKENTISLLRQKLSKKNNDLVRCQQQLDEINQKLGITLKRKEQIAQKMTQKQISQVHLQMERQIQNLAQKYEQEIKLLKQKTSHFENYLVEKQREKQNIIYQLDSFTEKHTKQLAQYRQRQKKNEISLQQLAHKSHEQKMKTIQSYEAIIRQLKQKNYREKQFACQKQLVSIDRTQQCVKQLEEKLKSIKHKHQIVVVENENLKKAEKDYQLKIRELDRIINEQKRSNLIQKEGSLNLIQSVKAEEKLYKNLKIQYDQLKNDYYELKHQNDKLNQENSIISKKRKELQIKITNMVAIIAALQQQANKSKDQEINMNAELTANIVSLKESIKFLQTNKQSITEQLCAQRLENARLKEQLQQTKNNLKRQYELSIQNVRKQLQFKVKEMQNTCPQSQLLKQRQQLYVNLRDIERKYQILTSQVVTVEDMMHLVSKASKRYVK